MLFTPNPGDFGDRTWGYWWHTCERVKKDLPQDHGCIYKRYQINLGNEQLVEVVKDRNKWQFCCIGIGNMQYIGKEKRIKEMRSTI